MDKRTYSFVVGIILVIAAIVFFTLPAFLPLDPLIPFVFSLVSFILGIGFFIIGAKAS